jgi:hypothetical protein
MALRSGLLAGALMLAACGPRGSTIDLAWTGADTGRATLAATALRCGAGPVQLLGMSGDTGIAIALYSSGDPRAGAYRVSRSAATAARPAASVGARWLDSAVVLAYRGTGGEITLAANGATLTGAFSVQAQRMEPNEEVTLTGSFRGVPIGPCAADSTGPGV